jgi:hypothetical protein
MKKLNRFWLLDCVDEEDIFAQTSWMVPGLSRTPVRKKQAAVRKARRQP